MNVAAAESQYVKIWQTAHKLGIAQHCFLGFGTLLGKIREDGLIAHDDDTDFCVLADKLTREQEDQFYEELDKLGLFKARRREKRRDDSGRLIWCSLKEEADGTKNCIWFWQKWKNFYWHTKGDDWVIKIGPRMKPPHKGPMVAIMKGIRAELLEELMEVDFLGEKVNVPRKYGTVLDLWYPGWATPKTGGASKEDYLAVINNWNNEGSWIFRRRS